MNLICTIQTQIWSVDASSSSSCFKLQGFIYNEIDFVSQLASTDCKMMLRDVWEKLNTTGFKFEP